MRYLLGVLLTFVCLTVFAADPFDDKFRQLDELLPTPNVYRAASGAPGHAYWQQRADYVIRATLDENKHQITGSEQITYYNKSPDTLHYLWLQVDQNIYRPDAESRSAAAILNKEAWTNPRDGGEGSERDEGRNVKFDAIRSVLEGSIFDGGMQIRNVAADGKPLKFTVNKTMMRIDLPTPLKAGDSFVFSLEWRYNINNQKVLGGRSGVELFDDSKNGIYEIAQWFPHMAAYYDAKGWQHKQFLGAGEFTLEFGDFDVSLTVPSDHIVAATGELQNADEALSSTQRERLKQARSAAQPVLIVTQAEAELAEKSRSETQKTWHFKATNVRDFAWASSRKFIWDAQGFKKGETDTMAMSFYPKEGNPLWGQYSTQAVIHTIDQYSRFSFDYPYPVAISVNGSVGGMEYPMICFNGPRPVRDKKTGELTYSKRAKYGLISVIIHEVGHNYYPMIVNSDERQWTWMDEGLNTFLQSIAERAWEEKYPSGRGDPRKIIDYMRSRNQVPIMTNSESLLQFGPNAYAKPATALTILRETIMGRELFDFAFREYARRWKFKRPTPADFFRTMEDASGVDLDWFWRGWFYTTDAVDISIDNITEYTISSKNPDTEKALKKALADSEPVFLGELRDRTESKRLSRNPELRDFYNEHDDYTVTNKDRNKYNETMETLEPWEKLLLANKKHLYLVDFSNLGGLVMPLILEIELKSGAKTIERIPAEIWRYSPKKITKLIVTDEPIVGLTQDPYWETADIDISNNSWPRKLVPSRLELFKTDRERGENLMRDMREPLKDVKKESKVDKK